MNAIMKLIAEKLYDRSNWKFFCSWATSI